MFTLGYNSINTHIINNKSLFVANIFQLLFNNSELITMKIINTQKIVFIIYGMGLMLDHLTTNIGVKFFGLKESNELTFFLIKNGLWAYVDILLFISVVLLIRTYWDILTLKGNKFILAFPLISGSVRMFAGIWNMVTLLNI